MNKCLGLFTVLLVCSYAIITLNSGCAQIGSPTGGPRDTIAPILVKAIPPEGALNVKGNKISLNFNEYIDVQDLQNNLLVSPVQARTPVILYNLKNITIKFKDSLLPNTTYSINFGNAIRDINEGNITPNFTYIFSTGNALDSLSFSGKVFLAESGKTDTTMIAMLYRNADDSAVQKRKPNYIARIKRDGSFTFYHLPEDKFKVYALKDGDGGKTYNSKTEIFAFLDSSITIAQNTTPVTLYASALEKEIPHVVTPVKKPGTDKKLHYTLNLEQKTQSLLQPLQLTFTSKVKTYDTSKILITDTSYRAFTNTKIALDSTGKLMSINVPWQPEADYILLLPKDAVQDSAGNTLARNDTLKFKAKGTQDYGRVVLRFTGLDLGKHPILQFVEGETVKYSYPLTTAEWTNKLFPPGEYEARILYDRNQNGIWDPGNYSKKLQPEIAVPIPAKISIRADWDNESDIHL